MALNRATQAGFCLFDERNAGGRYQTHAELKHFKHVLHTAQAIVDVGERIEDERDPTGHLTTRARADALSTLARRMKAEQDAHALRIANMNRRITEYHNKEDKRLQASTATTNFPAMHPTTQKISGGTVTIRIRSPRQPGIMHQSVRSPQFPNGLTQSRSPYPSPRSSWDPNSSSSPSYSSLVPPPPPRFRNFSNRESRDLYCDSMLEYIRQQKDQALAGGYSEQLILGRQLPAHASELPAGWEEKRDEKG